MSSILFGKPLTASPVLNILITLVEIAAAAGFYASPAIIYRFSIKETPCAPEFSRRFNLIYTLGYSVIVGAVLLTGNFGIIALLGVLIWVYFNYGILTCGYVYPDGTVKKSNIIVALFDKFQEIMVYLIVGVLTTVVSWAVFYVLSFVLDSDNSILLAINTVLNWSAGVAVAYPMNRSWVFHSKNPEIGREFMGFAASRVTTLVIEEVVMIVCVNVLGIDQFISKYVIASILVIILNYVFSKLLVFNKKK